MKKVVTTITAAIFALGLVSAGLAQTTQTPAKPEVKKESSAVATPVAPKEAGKPEVTKPGAVKTEAAKPGEKPAAKEAGRPLTNEGSQERGQEASQKGKGRAKVRRPHGEVSAGKEVTAGNNSMTRKF